jgi:uncharacterized lipoprotein
MQHIKTVFIIFLITLLAGCSYIYGDRGMIRSRSTAYTKANSIPPLKIPPGLSSSTMEDHYPVSDADYPSGKIPVNLIPPELE